MKSKIVDMVYSALTEDTPIYSINKEDNHKGVRIREVYVNGEVVDRGRYRTVIDPRTISFTNKMPIGIKVTALVDEVL